MSLSTQTHTSGAIREVTPDDGTDLTLGACRALFVGGDGGDVSIVDLTGETVVLVGAVGVVPVQTARVNATGTTATSILALY